MQSIIFNKLVDEIAIIAPSSGCLDSKNKLLTGIKLLEDKGFKCKYDENILSGHPTISYFASTKKQRQAELQNALLDPKVKIIWAFRGGYGSSEIAFDFLDFHPNKHAFGTKILIGFSDITVLILLWQKLKMPAIHGSVINSLTGKQSAMLEPIISVLSGQKMSFPLTPLNDVETYSTTEVKGQMTGGNLSIMCHMIGSKLTPNTKNKIIFLEDVNEKGYHIHRYLLQMKNAGLFTNAKALILGDFTESDDKLNASLEDFCMNHLSCPAFRAEGIGHSEINYPIVIGTKSVIKNNSLTINSPFKLI